MTEEITPQDRILIIEAALERAVDCLFSASRANKQEEGINNLKSVINYTEGLIHYLQNQSLLSESTLVSESTVVKGKSK